ncbi:unnamed protein product, partial [marine sediment metagenome]
MAEQIVTLSPGEGKVVSFEATPTVVKTYQVSVDGLTGSFKAIPAGAWVSPTGHNDPDEKWGDEIRAYDGNLNTAASSPRYGEHYLELTLMEAIRCSKVRVNAADVWWSPVRYYSVRNATIDVYYNAGWHRIFSGSLPPR